MSVRNILVKSLGYFGVYLVTLVNGYFISLLGMSVIFSAVCTVWSFIEALPQFIAENYGKLLLLASLPIGIVLSIYIMFRAIPRSKKHKKQDNGNH